MHYSIAIYPGEDPEASDCYQYINKAAEEGFDEVFMSLHLPEFSLEEQLCFLEKTAEQVHAHKMNLTADIGGSQLDKILRSSEYSERVRKADVDFIRLDYGFSMEQVREISAKWGIRGFMINGSVYSGYEMEELKREFDLLDENIDLRACHNYYPRPESGLSYEFFLQQNDILNHLKIPVYSCVPDQNHPRGPLYRGLPTVEKHRDMAVEEAVLQLVAGQSEGGIILADEYASSETMRSVRETAERAIKMSNTWPLAFEWAPGVTENEKKLLGGVHHLRYDSNDEILRSQSSRQMSEYACRIAPRMPAERKRGSITVDNSLYKRYSGEVEIVLKDLEADPKVNVIGQIEEQDIWKLYHYRYGIDYTFDEKGKS